MEEIICTYKYVLACGSNEYSTWNYLQWMDPEMAWMFWRTDNFVSFTTVKYFGASIIVCDIPLWILLRGIFVLLYSWQYTICVVYKLPSVACGYRVYVVTDDSDYSSDDLQFHVHSTKWTHLHNVMMWDLSIFCLSKTSCSFGYMTLRDT
jgi:hypothetical protein